MTKNKITTSKIIINLMFIIYALFCIIPLILVLSISLTDEIVLFQNGYSLIPEKFSLDAYKYVLSGSSTLVNAYVVTIIVTIVGTFCHLFISSMFAYTLSRKEVKYANVVSFLVFFALLFNGGIVPQYILLTKYLHMKNTIFVLIFPYLVSSVNVIIMKNFFKSTVPDSIVEAARIDGSGEFSTFLKIVLPISKPVLATIGLFVAVFYWNDWFTCSLYVEDSKLYVLQFLLQSIMNNIQYLQSNDMLQKSAASLPSESARMVTCILAIGPIILTYPFLQKYFVKGLTLGAVKE